MSLFEEALESLSAVYPTSYHPPTDSFSWHSVSYSPLVSLVFRTLRPCDQASTPPTFGRGITTDILVGPVDENSSLAFTMLLNSSGLVEDKLHLFKASLNHACAAFLLSATESDQPIDLFDLVSSLEPEAARVSDALQPLYDSQQHAVTPVLDGVAVHPSARPQGRSADTVSNGVESPQPPCAAGGTEMRESKPAVASLREALSLTSGPIRTDRGSRFQAHTAVVASRKDVRDVLELLTQDKTIQDAAHPTIYAYRFLVDKGGAAGTVLDEAAEDDGEGGAAGKLLFLLQVGSVVGRIIVVTRWFGGVLLGPTRFRHICSVATEILQAQGVLAPPSDNSSRRKHRK